MSPPKSEAQPDIYVGLLFVSMGALLTAMVFLLIELNRYEWLGPS